MTNSEAKVTLSAGIECPTCKSTHSQVVYTRKRPNRIIRRRICRACGRKMLSAERVIG